MRLRLDLAYDGTDFHGWARQPGLRTVEAVLADALRTALHAPDEISLVVAGRTDAGVHARGQVVHADVEHAALAGLLREPAGAGAPTAMSGVPAERGTGTLCSRLRGLLPPDVAVHGVTVAPDGFDARFSALWRRYRYHLQDDGVDPLRRRSVVACRHRLDDAAMAEAAGGLLGEHDFLAYCRPRPGASTVREVLDLTVARHAGLLVVEVRADAFCHHMVRSVVGALVAVGAGRRRPSWPGEVLRRRERDPAVTVLPARGLVLEEVGYPAAEELASRARQARRRRDLPPG